MIQWNQLRVFPKWNFNINTHTLFFGLERVIFDSKKKRKKTELHMLSRLCVYKLFFFLVTSLLHYREEAEIDILISFFFSLVKDFEYLFIYFTLTHAHTTRLNHVYVLIISFCDLR